MGDDFTAKTFRTWIAALLAMMQLAALSPGKGKTELARKTNHVLKTVADQLGNTPAICRKSYVGPRIIDALSSGTLASSLRRVRPIAGLAPAESALVGLLCSTSETAAAA